jgi:hypothetical protein
MKYTYFLVAKPGAEPVYGSDEWKSYAAEYGAWNEQATKADIHRGGEPAQPPETATTIRKEGGEVRLLNGPFADTDEKIVGWYLVEVDDLDEAMKWASKIPLVARGYGGIEIRPSIDFS